MTAMTFDNMDERTRTLSAMLAPLGAAAFGAQEALHAIGRTRGGHLPHAIVLALHGAVEAEHVAHADAEVTSAWLEIGTALLRHHGFGVIDMVLTARTLRDAQMVWDPRGAHADDFLRLAAMASPRWMRWAFHGEPERRFLDALVSARLMDGTMDEVREAARLLRGTQGSERAA